MGDETYNGWTNRETWAWNLLVSNDQYLQEHFVEVCVNARRALPRVVPSTPGRCTMADLNVTKYKVGDWLEDAFNEMIYEFQDNPINVHDGHESELVFRREIGSFWRINWSEIGVHYLHLMDEYEGVCA